ncbi:MAG: acyl-CoA dehydrogenase, partial [Hylemonella sp.]|nr:acyl-CoA dehydrogenase [Hylemonella sp.]
MSFFEESDRAHSLRTQLQAFMDAHIYPNDKQVWAEAAGQRWDSAAGWTTCPTVARLKVLAR